jgi:hypothetical protein
VKENGHIQQDVPLVLSLSIMALLHGRLAFSVAFLYSYRVFLIAGLVWWMQNATG